MRKFVRHVIAALTWVLAASSGFAQQPAPQRLSEYVSDAKISNVSPVPLIPGQPFLATVRVRLNAPLTQPELERHLRVYINALPATAAAGREPPADLDTRSFGNLPTELTVTLFGTVPPAAAPDRERFTLSTVAPSVGLSIYSALDGHEIAKDMAPIGLAPAPAEPPAVEARAFGMLAPWQWVVIGLAVLVIAAAAMFQRRRAAVRITELEAAVQWERHRINKFGFAETVSDTGSPAPSGKETRPRFPRTCSPPCRPASSWSSWAREPPPWRAFQPRACSGSTCSTD